MLSRLLLCQSEMDISDSTYRLAVHNIEDTTCRLFGHKLRQYLARICINAIIYQFLNNPWQVRQNNAWAQGAVDIFGQALYGLHLCILGKWNWTKLEYCQKWKRHDIMKHIKQYKYRQVTKFFYISYDLYIRTTKCWWYETEEVAQYLGYMLHDISKERRSDP
jgi:hypothetical protein